MKDYTSQATSYLKEFGNGSDPPKNKRVSHSELSSFLWELVGGYSHKQPGSRLVQYGMGGLPQRKRNKTVIYSSYLSSGKPFYPPVTVPSWLKKKGISRIIVGHQPNGDLPWIFNVNGLQVVSADTAYSGNVKWPVAYLHEQFNESFSTPSTPSPHYKDDKYMTYMEYLKEYHPEVLPSFSKFHEIKSTRSPFEFKDMLFEFVDGIDQIGSPSTLCINGMMSDRSSYQFQLEHFETNINNSFVGSKVINEALESRCLVVFSFNVIDS
jgi:hypothetical protein